MNLAYCPFCMTPLSGNDECRSCGKNRFTYETEAHQLPAGTILQNRYHVGRVLGEGGFGITYLGYDSTLDLRVAIKEFFPKFNVTRTCTISNQVRPYAGPQAAEFDNGKELFIDEAKMLAQLEKQSVIVGVRDFFAENNTSYIVLEYVQGITLTQLMCEKGGLLEPDELFGAIEPLFDALSELHAIGLIHRDISPDNIMLENGHVRLIDFGCARECIQNAQTLTVMLKDGYSPVEQYTRNSKQGPWTDVYALCATIYTCLTGSMVPSALDRLASDGLVPPSKLGVRLSAKQESALLRGLRVQPRRRWKRIADLKDALYKQDSIVPPSPSVFSLPLPAIVGAAIAAALLIALVFSHPWSHNSEQKEESGTTQSIVPKDVASEDDTQNVTDDLDIMQFQRDDTTYKQHLSQNLEEQFENAISVHNQQELFAAERLGQPIVIAENMEVVNAFTTTPVLIPKGVTLTATDSVLDKSGRELAFSDTVINYGTICGNICVQGTQFINHGTVGDQNNPSASAMIVGSGTVVNVGSMYLCGLTRLYNEGALYNKGEVYLDGITLQDDADLFNRGTIHINGDVSYSSSVPLYNAPDGSLTFSNLSKMRYGAHIVNWGSMVMDSSLGLGSPIIQNEGLLKCGYNSLDSDGAMLFGHGTFDMRLYQKPVYELSIGKLDSSLRRAQVTTEEELRDALTDESVDAVVLVEDVDVSSDLLVSKPLDIRAFLDFDLGTKMVVDGAEVYMGGGDRSIAADNITLRNGSKLWGSGLELSGDQTMNVCSSLLCIFDSENGSCGCDLGSGAKVVAEGGSMLLFENIDESSNEITLKDNSFLGFCGWNELLSSKLTLQDSILIQHGSLSLPISTWSTESFCRWYAMGGTLETPNSVVEFGEHTLSHTLDTTIKLGHDAIISNESTWWAMSTTDSDAYFAIESGTTLTNRGKLWLEMQRHSEPNINSNEIDGTVQNDGDIITSSGMFEESDLRNISGNAPEELL